MSAAMTQQSDRREVIVVGLKRIGKQASVETAHARADSRHLDLVHTAVPSFNRVTMRVSRWLSSLPGMSSLSPI